MAWAPDDIDAAEFGRRRTAKPTLVAEISGAPAGFTDLAPHGHIDMLFVDPVHRGQGVARALLETVEAMARAQGIARLTTDASITGKPIFERHGFTVVTGQTVTRNGQQLNNYRMEKTLD